VAVLGEVIQRFRLHGRFVDFTSLIHQIQSTFDPSSPESKHDVLDPVIGAELLVLDELAAQKPSAWVNDVLYLIMNTRYTRRLPTLFTTNYRLDPAAPKTERIQVSGRTTMVPKTLDRGRDPEGAAAFDETVLLSSRLPAMLVSRLYEMAQPVKLDAVEDFRREHAVHGAHLR
jgi:hypothetical protein